MNAAAIVATEAVRPIRRVEYDRLVDAGVFEGEHVELLWGVVVEMSPQGAPHSWVISVLTRHFAALPPDRALLRVQLPLAAGELAEPEPDLAVVPPSDEWRVRQPDRALLVVEIARTSQRIDRKKLSLYATAGVPEAWLVDLAAEAIEVYSQPSDGRYTRLVTVRRGASVAPLAFPEAVIAVDDVLP